MEGLEGNFTRPRERRRFHWAYRFSPFFSLSNNLGNLLFRSKVTQAVSTDRVLAQFCHNSIGCAGSVYRYLKGSGIGIHITTTVSV
jgi:hypothetical protein